MPNIARTIIPRIKNSIRNKGVLRTAWSCVLGPYQLIQNYRRVRRTFKDRAPDEFDVRYGVETTTRVHLTDLKIDSPNWVYAGGYWPTPPDVFTEALSGLEISFKDFSFIDLGSGKGRVLLMASDYPFREIIGVEFSPELHAIAEQNVRNYSNPRQACRDIRSLCMDFTLFEFPDGPLFVFLYNPSSEAITLKLAENLAHSLQSNPRPAWVLYVTPTYDVFSSGKPLRLRQVKSGKHYHLYNNAV
jgi:SAM-dependent methyltransferase